MKLVSWNVNGLRACAKKGFFDYFQRADADVFCLQETKMQPHQAEIETPGYFQYWNSAEKKGYSGTAAFTRREPISVSYDIGDPAHVGEGRAITLELEKLYLVTVYPQCSGRSGASPLPDGVGGRLPGLSALPGREKAGGGLRGYECGP